MPLRDTLLSVRNKSRPGAAPAKLTATQSAIPKPAAKMAPEATKPRPPSTSKPRLCAQCRSPFQRIVGRLPDRSVVHATYDANKLSWCVTLTPGNESPSQQFTEEGAALFAVLEQLDRRWRTRNEQLARGVAG